MNEQAREILRTLIGFDTVSSNSNRQLIDWVCRFLDERSHPYWLIENAEGTKANLLARIGPDVPGGIILSGHSDVVPVGDQDWQSDPWTLSERDDRYYGRGVADMKGFIALALALLDKPVIGALRRPVILAITYDEEVGCLGAPSLIAQLADHVAPPLMAIIGEPTSMKVVSVHKGLRVFDVEVIGREAHSSQRATGISAITVAAELMASIGTLDAEARLIPSADDPCSPPGTTLSVGVVEGGTASNILARRCTFCWDLRAVSEDDADRYERRIGEMVRLADEQVRRIAPEGGVRMTRRAAAPPLELHSDSEAEAVARALTGDNGLAGAAFVAEAGLYQRAGVPAVLCGPGSIEQAHQPNEWIAIDQLAQCDRFLDRLAERLTQ